MENQSKSGGCGSGCGCHSLSGDPGGTSRRTLLKAAGVTLGAAAFAKALSPIVNWSRENLSVDDFLQQHYRELDSAQLAAVIKRLEEDTTTASGIIIPDSAKEKPVQGNVIAVGKGKVTEDGKVLPLDVKVGDKVLFGKYSGTEVKLDGKEFLMMREDDILGVVE